MGMVRRFGTDKLRRSRPVSRIIEFLKRHRWSVPLAVLSALCFAQLAMEVREGELAPIDATISEFVVRARGSIDRPMLLLTEFGSGKSMTLLAIIAVLVLWWKKRRKEALFMTTTGLGTLILNVGMKLLFARERPVDVLYLIDVPSSFSFPSGHAMGSTGILLSLAVVAHVLRMPSPYRMLVLALIALLLLGIATSRIYFGVHFPSDVVGGLLAGAAWVSAVTGWFYPRLLPGEETQEG